MSQPLDLDQIYNLLPEFYRTLDTQIALASNNALDPSDYQTLQQLLAISGPLTNLQQSMLADLQGKQQRGPLKSMISILSEQIEVLQESLYQGYDDLFIETCADWVVPYIAGIVGVRGLVDVPSVGYTVRAAVADTIRNRRRKGTVPVIESIAREVTGWDANVVEYFQVLATTQFMNHLRPSNQSFADIRNADSALLNTPFDAYARTAEMRNIELARGRYNIPNIGIFLWRLGPQQMEHAPAFQVDDRRFCFDPLGLSIPLFTLPATEPSAQPRATPYNVAMPISRRMLYADLSSGVPQYYGPGLSIYLEGQNPSIPVQSCNLSDVLDSSGNVIGWSSQPQTAIAIDPQLGRIAFPATLPPPGQVFTTYCYGFSAEIGAGPYERTFTSLPDVIVPDDATTLQAALDLAVGMLSATKISAIVEVRDNNYYVETPTVIIPDNGAIVLRSNSLVPGTGHPVLVLNGDLTIVGGQKTDFTLDGFLVGGGGITVQQAVTNDVSNPITVSITRCTMNPGLTPAIQSAPLQLPSPSIWIETSNVAVSIDHSILGAIRVSTGNTVSLTACIVDALSPSGVAYACPYDALAAGASLTVVNSTIIGKVRTQLMTLASNTIFLAELEEVDSWSGPLLVDQIQQGCVRFCYIPQGSYVPRPFHCYPVSAQASTPIFTSVRFGDPGYCQLTSRSGQILTGADDQSEVGVFHDVFQAQRLSNLNLLVADYLRFGMSAGIFFAT